MGSHLRDMDNVIRVKRIKGVTVCYILFCRVGIEEELNQQFDFSRNKESLKSL